MLRRNRIRAAIHKEANVFFERTEIPGAYTVELDKRTDERGFFARGWCQSEFKQQGLPERIAQINISYNRYKHTLRGFHYQIQPYQEDKLLRCTRGAIHDVLLDLRPDSPTFRRHISVVLSAENYRSLLVPKGCANAFLTLQDETEVTYLVSEFYTPEAERGVRWNDPAFGIEWPVHKPAVISEKDSSWPDFKE
jgi:dTDP-4-dehydrorhamnose 3,5-epimerase